MVQPGIYIVFLKKIFDLPNCKVCPLTETSEDIEIVFVTKIRNTNNFNKFRWQNYWNSFSFNTKFVFEIAKNMTKIDVK